MGEGAGLVLSGGYSTTDGFYRNRFLGSDTIDDQEIWSIDGRFLAEIGPATELDVKARYADLSGASINFNAAFHLPNFAGVNPDFFEDVNDHPFDFYSNIRPTNTQKTFEMSAKIEHEYDDVTLTAWALYSDVDQYLQQMVHLLISRVFLISQELLQVIWQQQTHLASRQQLG